MSRYRRRVEVRSLGFRTDLMLRQLAGSTVTAYDGFLAVRTPHNPTFYWGNFLLYPAPPVLGDAARWIADFASAFPDAQHVAIGVDGTAGDLGADGGLRAAGLEPEQAVVLVTDRVLRVRDAVDAELRPLHSDDDWRQAVELQLAITRDDSRYHREFVTRRMRDFAALTRAGRGVHVGAFVDGTVRAALGLYTDGSGLGRYQIVETHPDFRRRGLAAGLLALAADVGRSHLGIETFVIVAEPDYVAIDLYRRAGFVDAERQVQWQRVPDPNSIASSR